MFVSPHCDTAQVVYSASHIDTIPETLSSSITSFPCSSSTQQTYSTSSTVAPITIPSINPAAMVMGGGASSGETSIQTAILGQNEVATQIQGAMTGIQGPLMGHSDGSTGIQSNQQNAQSGGGENLITGQTSSETAATSIQESIAQSGAVGGDSIQDSIQDSIMGEGAVGGVPPGIHQGAILGQPVGEHAGIQDSSQYLSPSMSAIPPSGADPSADGGTTVSDIASQLISQYVTSSRTVFPSSDPGSNAAVQAQETVETMQTDVAPQPVDTTTST